MRHADAGYESAINTANERGVDLRGALARLLESRRERTCDCVDESFLEQGSIDLPASRLRFEQVNLRASSDGPEQVRFEVDAATAGGRIALKLWLPYRVI